MSCLTADWQEWHTGQEAGLAVPHGFLAITGQHRLGEEPQRFPDAPGASCTDLATCPLPPAESWLPVSIEAGEKIPRERGGS
ncbi:DUF1684 domain-containing protein [Streptomyces collinus]